ncbi:MAG: alpha/beta hydrolase [Gammaproteobacteria bacterium]|nr:alpha/beta hydrolase [Gammaproteobacteria bacterium]
MRWVAAILGWGVAVYAGLALYLYVFQARYIYFPELPSRQVTATPADIGLAFDAVRLGTADGETLAGWYIPAPAARGTLLYLHGNGGNIGHRLVQIEVFHRLGLNILIVDYRGYGASSGKPGEEGTYQDALAGWDYLTRKKHQRPDRIVLFGESLGGSIAAWLAARQTPAGLVIYASFTSVTELAQVLYPMFPASRLARYRYDTRAALQRVSCPLLILHSPEDEIIPFSHGQALLAAAHAPKRLVELRGGHNDALLLSREIYAQEVGAFIRTILPEWAE